MEHSAATTKRNALLAAFGCAVGYLLGGKLLALLPVPALLPERLLSFLHHCAAAPIAEELVFRGAIQRFAKPLGRWQAVLLQAVLFALQHSTPAGALRERTGKVWPGMLLHTLNNLLVFAAG